MARYLYEVELTPDEEGGYCVSVPDLEGCFSQGDTIEDALDMASDALITYVASLLKYGEAIPAPKFGHEAPKGGMVVAVSFETDTSYIIDAVSPSEAARMLGVSRGRVSQMIRSGQLTANKSATETWVDRASIESRMASTQRAGRPRKEPATA
ncbi:MAG: type II toxin-antitoxin system HicB family antitoxin [Coriobacteriaceae bacterium]|jgi:predicted RNase H-like HicB family nuclease|nr:type II toxin-antitoxin system HicB family antitoxin [Coriobacteriaceae bacterium]